MTLKKRASNQKGFTLIELLLYIAILGSLLMGVSLYFVTSTTARVKNQSIAEVDQQGTLAMEYITQTIRNADSITSPAAGSSAASLTLAVPTPALSPTIFSLSGGGSGTAILGYDQDGGTTDSANANFISATPFTASASGTITTLHARVANVGTNPNNRAQMAIYSGASTPDSLLASSDNVVLTADSWNDFAIASVSVTSGQKYWLSYNTNALGFSENNLRYRAGSPGQSMYTNQTYGTWPSSWSGFPKDVEYSMYAEITVTGGGGGAAALQVKEGTAAEVPLTNGKVVVSNLTFKNLSSGGTPGVVQISFTISRVNTGNRNEYDYQKTFTATAALRP